MADAPQLQWASSGDGLVADRYRITPFSASFDPTLHWRLEVVGLGPRGEGHPVSVTLHQALVDAKSEARRHHHNQHRRMRIGALLGVGCAAWVGLLFLDALTGPSVGTVVELILIVVLFNLGAGSLLDAFGIARAAGMGALKKAAAPEPRTWIDRAVVVLLRWIHNRRLAALTHEAVQPRAITLS